MVFGSGASRKVAIALQMMWSVLENIAKKNVAGKVTEKRRRKNVDGDEGFLTTI